ncbi:restriction endonuclease subunit S [Pseudomonadales bacterium]|jgi:type I restriction enzyme, S subunit|nr:restriction endonuclease subunit S [Pseudomonadales bacterium]
MAKVESLITDNLDIWSSTVKAKSAAGRGTSKKIDLYGIEKLRELILELAVRGLLVPQDPSDEPASELLKKINTARAQALNGAKKKRRETLPLIEVNEKPLEVPAGWVRCRLGDIIQISSGAGLTAANMAVNGEVPVYGGNGVTGYHDQGNVFKETLVIGRVGYYCGSIHITPVSAWVTDNAFITTFFEEGIYLQYLAWLLKGTDLKENESATAQPVISGRKVYPIIVGLPPTAEQHRIVAKVDELMALCDKLEAQQADTIEAHKTLVTTVLDALTKATEKESFDTAWARIAEHFDMLFTTEWSVERLKEHILQLGVTGKLTAPRPSAEEPPELLSRIAKIKEELVKSGQISKQKALPAISKDEIDFELPVAWSVERLGNLTCKLGSGSTPRGGKDAYVDSGIIFLRSQNIWNGEIRTQDVVYIDSATHKKMSGTRVLPGDVLLNITGASLGRTAIFPSELVEANVSQHVTIIRLIEPLMADFVHILIMSPLIQKFVWGRQVGMAIEGLSKKVLENFEFPVPPLEEQERIVKKVKQLLATCEQLKGAIGESQHTQLLLADAITEQSVA